MPHRRSPLSLLVATAVLLFPGTVQGTDDADWQPAGDQDGVALAFRTTDAGYRAFRGAVRVCTSLDALQAFVADADRFVEWIPFTQAARALPEPGPGELYYLRTGTPWPLQPRDMIYRLEAMPPAADGTLRIAISGEPDALPAVDGVVRMAGADGQWTLGPDSEGIDVTLRMAVDSGGAPAFFANRRLAATVAGTLANLRARFPCRD